MEADTDSDTEKPVAFRYVVIKTSLFGEQGYTNCNMSAVSVTLSVTVTFRLSV